MHWIQQGSVAHFPTDNTRQIEFGPWSGYVISHLFLLTGSDRLVNLPQWIAMAFTIITVSLLVDLLSALRTPRQHEGNPPGASIASTNAGAMAALFAMTVPMGMMQALTPQTDYLTVFWMSCAFAFALTAALEPGRIWPVAACGIACGLGALTKGTAYIYAAPLLLAGAFWLARQPVPRIVKLKAAGCFCAAFFLLNAPHLIRNQTLFGSPLGSKEIHDIERNGRMTPAAFASNLIRNLALHNNCGFRPVTVALNRLALTIHGWTGAPIDDPETTYPAAPVRFYEKFVLYDDYASAPLHVFWIGVALALGLWHFRKSPHLWVYAGLVIASFLLFVALLKFQVWHSRFHLAYFILLSPFVALAISRAHRCLQLLSALSVIAYALVCLRCNEARPIFYPWFVSLPREAQYLDIHASSWTPALQSISDEIVHAGCQNVGLKLGFDAFEYPIWLMLKNRGFTGTIEHCYVEHVSGRIPSPNPDPSAIITRVGTPPDAVRKLYPKVTVHPPLMVLWRDVSQTEQRAAR
jgi:4-amino-4-deoxy-L-arabinose transferase-like glycosyltransferase